MQKLICVKTFSDIQEGQIAKSFLISEGIDAELFQSYLAFYLGIAFGFQERLMVLENQQKKAFELLNQAQEEYNKQFINRSLKDDLIQYFLIMISIIFLSYSGSFGVLILVPLSRFVRNKINS